MYKKYLKLFSISLLIIFFKTGVSFAQSTLDLRFNEILVYNDSNYVDDFGQRHPWIEIFNTAYNTVDLGGCYITDDMSNPMKYYILKGQPVTPIAPRSYIVLWADNLTTRGILHLNFTLSEGKTIALFDSDGRTLIDSVKIPSNLQRDVTFGRVVDGTGNWENLLHSTPKANNDLSVKATTGEVFKKMDPTGSGMTSIAMTVVFIALALLYFFFKGMARLLRIDINAQRSARAALKAKTGKITKEGDDEHIHEITGELNAAIAMTLYLYASELHDAENTVLTINKVSRTYSPWSSKIYTLRKTPN